ncbi:MAG: hypothetical protein ABSC01_11080 [Verrucomicrobiota bacterium]|jgi:hypothetical protein
MVSLDNFIGFLEFSAIGTFAALAIIDAFGFYSHTPIRSLPHGKSAAMKVSIGFGLLVGLIEFICKVNSISN